MDLRERLWGQWAAAVDRGSARFVVAVRLYDAERPTAGGTNLLTEPAGQNRSGDSTNSARPEPGTLPDVPGLPFDE